MINKKILCYMDVTVHFRNSAESTRRCASGCKQQLYGIRDMGQTVSQLSNGQRIRGQCDHAQVV